MLFFLHFLVCVKSTKNIPKLHERFASKKPPVNWRQNFLRALKKNSKKPKGKQNVKKKVESKCFNFALKVKHMVGNIGKIVFPKYVKKRAP